MGDIDWIDQVNRVVDLLASPEYSEFRAQAFGAPPASQSGALAAARLAPLVTPVDIDSAAKRMGLAIDAISTLDARAGRLAPGEDFVTFTLTAFVDALDGATLHGAANPESLSPIQSRVGALREIRSNLEIDTSLRAGLGEIVMRYGRAGGVGAWAAERGLDLPASTRLESAPLVGDVHGDSKTSHAPDLAEQRRLNDEFLNASQAGAVDKALAALKRGADPQTVNQYGYGAGDLCRARGNFEAAKTFDKVVANIQRASVIASIKGPSEALVRV